MKPKICSDIEKALGTTFETSPEFDELAALVFKRTRKYISPTTLKRIWGYVKEDVTPRKGTYDLLARLLGFKSYCAYLAASDNQQSNPIFSRHISTDSLERGQKIRLAWPPNRECVVQYLGDNRFTILEAHNTRLAMDDTFHCSLFIEHEPLYIHQLIQQGAPPVSYVAGKSDGITFELL